MTNAEIGRKIWFESIHFDKPEQSLKPKKVLKSKLTAKRKVFEPIIQPGFALTIKPEHLKTRGLRVIYSRPDEFKFD